MPANITYNGNIKSQFDLMPGGFPIKKMIEQLSMAIGDMKTILDGKNIIITEGLRDIKPNYHSYQQIADEFGLCVEDVAFRFWNRKETPGISRQEYAYREAILRYNGNDIFSVFVEYSAHFPYGGDKPYSCAVDFVIPGLSESNNNAVLRYIKKEYPGLEGMYHKVGKTGGWHFHIEDQIAFNQVSSQLKSKVDAICGYAKVEKSTSNSPAVPFKSLIPIIDGVSPKHREWDAKLELKVAQTRNKEAGVAKINEQKDGRTMLPEDIQDDGLMEVLRIGDIHFGICPVTQISYSQSAQYVRFSTLRTVGDPKIASDTVPNNITLNIIFPNADAINNQLASLVAQFMVTPVTVVQSRFIARTLKPITVNHKNEINDTFDSDKTLTPQDESMWMIMTDINIRSVNGFPEAFEAYVTLEPFEDRVFGDSLRFLVGTKDVREKYKRKQLIMNNSYIIPSEKNMVKSASNFEPGVIDVTPDPNVSQLYKDFYKSVKTSLRTYDPSEYEKSGGKFSVLYNAQDFSRESIRSAKLKIQEAYNKSLRKTEEIIQQLGPTERNFLIGKDIDPLNRDTLRQIANNTVDATVAQILAVSQTETAGPIQGIRYGIMDPIKRLQALSKEGHMNIDRLGNAPINMSHANRVSLLNIFNKILARVGAVNKYTQYPLSYGTVDAQGNPLSDQAVNPSHDITSTGLIEDLTILLGQNLMPSNPENVKTLSDTAKKINEALTKLIEYCVVDTTDVDADGFPKFPNKFQLIDLVDGKDSYTSGISFSMSNKVVPQQVIGWRYPTFQHLGRSDWSINMNIVSKGDKAVRNIMYVLQRTGILSKQIQYTSPAKFMNLDTNIYITAGDPIFASLGIEGLVLNTVEISSIPGQPNMFQINLGLEQSDLSIRDMESIKEAPFKKRNNEALTSLYNDVLPVLKSMIIRSDSQYYGRFLDFQKIKSVVDDPSLVPFWQFYGLIPLNPKEASVYDYMDKYSFYKAMMGVANIKDPNKNWDLLMKDIFPTVVEIQIKLYNTFDTLYKNIVKSVIQKNKVSGVDPLTSANTNISIYKSLKQLNELVQLESEGKLIWQKGLIKTPDNLAKSLEPYFESIGHLVNSHLNTIYDNAAKSEGSGIIDTIGSNIFNIAVVGGIATNIVGLVILGSNPIGWGIIAALSIGAGIQYLYNKTEEYIQIAKDTIGSMIPTVFSTVVNGKLIDLTKELMADDASLSMFGTEFEIGKTKNGDVITLQDKIVRIREAIGALLGSCYNDFAGQITSASATIGIPEALLDPAFYLYSSDFITTDLIKELKVDVNNTISNLVSKANVMALMLGNKIEKDYNISPKYDLENDLPASIVLPKGSSITRADLKWCLSVKQKITKINMDAFAEASVEKLTRMQNIQAKSEDAKAVFFNEYWKREKTGAFIETAFARLLLINEAFRFDGMMTALQQSTAKVSGLSQKIKEEENITRQKKGENFSIRDVGNKPQTEQYQQYDIFFNRKENNDSTWYDSIISAGSKDSPYRRANSINLAFQEKYKVSMDIYFTGWMSDIVKSTETIARCKKASETDSSAEVMALYNGLDADPRMLDKRVDQIQSMQDILFKSSITDNTGNPIRIFPTYKIYFIEEDAPEWGIYNDFYDYSAVQEITVVKDRESASDTCVIKLSNVTGKLTDSFAQNMPEIGSDNLPMSSMMLRPGMSILVKMGYSNNQVELPVVFYGIIIEVQPGPIVEIICQGYGAELNELIAPNEGVHHGIFGDVKALGDVATWAIQQATGLNHFGKTGVSDMLVRDTLRLSGTAATGMQGKMKIASFISGLPGLSYNDPRDDNIFLPYNMSNITDKELTSVGDSAISFIFSKFASTNNLTFDWYIRDQSIWDVLSEIVWFHPDYIKVVLPYNDNIFPFIPKIRNTLYIGPKRGYYKYTDMFSMIGFDSGVEFPNAEQVADLLFKIGKDLMTSQDVYAPEDIRFGDDESLVITNNNNVKELISLFERDTLLKQACEIFFSVNFESNVLGKEVNKVRGIGFAVESMTNKYMLDFTNVSTVLSRNNSKTIDVTSITKLDRNFTEALKKETVRNIGMQGVYYNIKGGHHQYKKVQQHHIATSYTNILNNNIIATGEGWANQIKLVCPPEPKDFVSIQDVQIEDRKDFITTIFNLDDNILDDQIRTKVMFINNIDPSLWDDSSWAKKVFKGEGIWTNVKEDRYASEDKYGNPVIKSCNQKDKDGQHADASEDVSKQKYLWETMPSRWRVGVSLLAQEAKNMYNGELTITGNSNIKPYDIIHMIDYVNDMHGSFEVGRVIHTLSPQTGFTTRIKPDLIVAQKNKFTLDEIFIASSMVSQSVNRSFANFLAGGLVTTSAVGFTHSIGTGIAGLAAGAAGIPAGVTAALSTVGLAAAAGLLVYGGYKTVKYHHERIIMTMNNMIGRDSLDILPLTYRNVPYVAGVEGIRKDSYLRHMYGAVTDKTGKYNVFERMGYMNAPLEFEFYSKVAGDSEVWSWVQSNILFNGKGSVKGGVAGAVIGGGIGGKVAGVVGASIGALTGAAFGGTGDIAYQQGRIIAKGLLNPGGN
jgi:hypothetical protein